MFLLMNDFEKITSFSNLYKAHCIARRGKRNTKEVIQFELNLSMNLTELSDSLKDGSYKVPGYYSFEIYDPKERTIHSLHYKDRVVQHCLCDEVLAPILEKKLIYDNAACRKGKGTHFALNRVTEFLRKYYRKYGTNGYILKCDIRKFFDSIDHKVLKRKLRKVIFDDRVLALIDGIIDSYESTSGKGLPLGNQTSQWFALYYLDGFDRLIKEKLHIKYYSRYMDDCVIIHEDKEYLKHCLNVMKNKVENDLHLSFNEKTVIFPIRNGVNYLGWHFYLTETGKVIRKVSSKTKKRYKRKLKYLEYEYANDYMSMEEIDTVLNSYNAHLSCGNTYHLRENALKNFVLKKKNYD